MDIHELLEKASDTSKQFSIEAFSFTHQHGLNIYFSDYDDLKEVTGETEYEFWSLRDAANDIELDVKEFGTLETVLEFIENASLSDLANMDAYIEIVDGNYATWDSVIEWHGENYQCEYKDDYDFGHYMAHEVGCLDIPEEVQPYFNYERYGRDMLMSGYTLIGDNVYLNC